MNDYKSDFFLYINANQTQTPKISNSNRNVKSYCQFVKLQILRSYMSVIKENI